MSDLRPTTNGPVRRLIITLTVLAIAAAIETPLNALFPVHLPSSLVWMAAVFVVWMVFGDSAIEHVVSRRDGEKTLSLGDIRARQPQPSATRGDVTVSNAQYEEDR